MSFVKYIMELYEYITNTVYCFIIKKILSEPEDDSNDDSCDPDHIPISEVMQRVPFQEDVIMNKYYKRINFP